MSIDTCTIVQRQLEIIQRDDRLSDRFAKTWAASRFLGSVKTLEGENCSITNHEISQDSNLIDVFGDRFGADEGLKKGCQAHAPEAEVPTKREVGNADI